MTTDVAIEEVAEEGVTKSPFAVIIELEHVVAHARQAAYDTVSGILKDKNIDLSPVQFSRYCLSGDPEIYLEELLDVVGAKRLSASKMAEDVKSGIAMQLSSNNLKVNPGIDQLISEVKKAGVQLGVITALPVELHEPLISKLGFEGTIEIFALKEEAKSLSRADVWLRLTKELGLPACNCTAVVGSATTCKAALTAGLRVAAVPDSFTTFQDFGGAYSVSDSLEDIDYKDLFDY